MKHLHLRISLATVLTAAGFAAAAGAASPEAAPVVIELFTSQSCSSCPPADAILTELSDRAGVIALGCHVTYWDHLSWRDTLSLKACTERQRAYAAEAGRGRLFTPELVVNGRTSLVGSQREAVVQAIREASRAEHLRLTRHDGQTLTTNRPATRAAGSLALELVAYGATVEERIGAGENHGRRVAYANPVTSIRIVTPPDDAPGSPFDVRLTAAEQRSPGLAILVHDGDEAGPIIAAGRLQRAPSGDEHPDSSK